MEKLSKILAIQYTPQCKLLCVWNTHACTHVTAYYIMCIDNLMYIVHIRYTYSIYNNTVWLHCTNSTKWHVFKHVYAGTYICM